MQYYISMWKNVANFKGRATRAEFWWALLVQILISFGLNWLGLFIGFFSTIITLYWLASYVPLMSLWVRRLHDIGKSGRWYFVCVILQVVVFAGLWMLERVAEGMDVDNLGMGMFLGIPFLMLAAGALLILTMIVIVFAAIRSQPNANKYGDAP